MRPIRIDQPSLSKDQKPRTHVTFGESESVDKDAQDLGQEAELDLEMDDDKFYESSIAKTNAILDTGSNVTLIT